MSVLGRLLKERSSAHMKSDWEQLSGVCSQIGGIYSAQGDYTNALKFHLEDKEVDVFHKFFIHFKASSPTGIRTSK